MPQNGRRSGITRTAVEYTANLNYKMLPQAVVRKAKLCILDLLASAMVGAKSEPGQIIDAFVEEIGGTSESTLIGSSQKTSCVNAALSNSTKAHALEIDDYFIHKTASAIHLGAVTIPPALALGEKVRASGSRLLTAIVAGYELGGRLLRALGSSHYLGGWHPTGTVGTVAAAVVSSKILGLTADQCQNAVGLALTQSSGLRISSGSYGKPFHAGMAARNGVTSALLAEKGFSGAIDVFDDARTFGALASTEFQPSLVAEDLGNEYYILKNSFKAYYCAGFDVADAAIKLTVKKNIKPDQVKRVEISTATVWADQDRIAKDLRTINSAKISRKYVAAICIVDRKCGLEQFTHKRMCDPQVTELMSRVHVRSNPEVDALIGEGHYSVKVTIVCRDGTKHNIYIRDIKGYYLKPLSEEELRLKFFSLARKVISQNKAEKLYRTVLRLEALENVSELSDLLCDDSVSHEAV